MLGAIIIVSICIIFALLLYFDIISWDNIKKKLGLADSKTQADNNAVQPKSKTDDSGPGGPGGYSR